ncbi:MAG: SDR family oxidoreductase [Lysobacterales bacterium]
MDLGLKGKHVFVAGASRGIGLAIAESFLQEGAVVSLTARGEASLAEAQQALSERFGPDRCFSMAGDMTRTEVIAQALDAAEAALGPIYCVVGNVGIDKTPHGWDIDDETFDIGFAQNCLASYRLAREAVRRALQRPKAEREGFNVLFISSSAGVEALKTPLTYGSSKATLNHLTRELARHLGGEGIRVNAVCPAMTVFPGGGWAERLAGPDRDHWIAYNQRETALQRFGTPEEAANVAVFLASPRASIVTSSVVIADAGQLK